MANDNIHRIVYQGTGIEEIARNIQAYIADHFDRRRERRLEERSRTFVNLR